MLLLDRKAARDRQQGSAESISSGAAGPPKILSRTTSTDRRAAAIPERKVRDTGLLAPDEASEERAASRLKRHVLYRPWLEDDDWRIKIHTRRACRK
jgi:hypothetical protein